jgi:DNA modification methylase
MPTVDKPDDQNLPEALLKFEFSQLDSPDFKEDSSGSNQIVRSKTLSHPSVQIASRTRQITVTPDYLLKVAGKYAWVLDAKAPGEQIKTGENVEQVYFYAIHPEIRVKYYALCNGREFIVFPIDSQEAALYFHLSELSQMWTALEYLLGPQAFKPQERQAKRRQEPRGFDYLAATQPSGDLKTRKQTAKRHFGVHAYFTRQSYDLVQAYIQSFTQKGDLVLDPYGGYGSTAIESLMLGRKAIHIDINPWSVFLAKSLMVPVDLEQLQTAFDRVLKAFEKHCPVTDEAVERALTKYPHPTRVQLPRDSDVQNIEELFTSRQLAQLAYLKSLIVKIKDVGIRDSLLLCFSSALNKFNLTFHYTRSGGGGDSGMFRYYRYRIAPQPGQNALSSIFRTKFSKLLAAKREMAPIITPDNFTNVELYKGDAAKLQHIRTESVDYIYTDPPYGSKIPYLDLSVMWNAWLDLPVTKEDYEVEAIEGGERKKTKADYSQRIAEAIREAYRVLKYDRWMSFVFQHQDPSYWHLIVETAQKVGFEYMGTVSQRVGQSSFKKRQNPFTVLHGQLTINFRKTRNPETIMKVNLGYETTQIVIQTAEAIIAKNQGATIEQIYNDLIVRGMEMGFLHELSREHQNIQPLLLENFEFNEAKQVYQLKKNSKFRTQIPVAARIRYYMISYMRQMERQNIDPTFDQIVLNIMPLLKNGITPKQQTILSVLQQVAQHVGNDRWRLDDRQLSLVLTGSAFEKEQPRATVQREAAMPARSAQPARKKRNG